MALIGGQFAVLQLRPARMMIEMPHGQRHIEITRLADRLAIIEAFQNRKKPRMALQHAGQRIEMARPSMAAKLFPWPLRLARRGNGRIHLLFGTIGDLCQKLARGRFIAVDLFGAGHKIPADEMAETRFMRCQPGARFRIQFRRGAIIHGFEIFSDAQNSTPRDGG